jgi:N-acetylmuramoyl-L-alanine amidase
MMVPLLEEGFMKKAVIYLLLGLFALMVVQPGLSKQPESETRVPQAAESQVTTNEDASLSTSQSGKVIAIDAGHGGWDTGYTSSSTIPEKEITMELALAIGRKLTAAGYEVYYTRTSDDVPVYDSETTANKDRLAAAKAAGADVLLSIQLTNSQDALTKGFALFTQPYELQTNLAQAIAEEISAINFSQYEGLDTDHYANFSILSDSNVPSVLLELGYITNSDDYSKLTDPSYQERIGQAVAQAFLDVLN